MKPVGSFSHSRRTPLVWFGTLRSDRADRTPNGTNATADVYHREEVMVSSEARGRIRSSNRHYAVGLQVDARSHTSCSTTGPCRSTASRTPQHRTANSFRRLRVGDLPVLHICVLEILVRATLGTCSSHVDTSRRSDQDCVDSWLPLACSVGGVVDTDLDSRELGLDSFQRTAVSKSIKSRLTKRLCYIAR